jgi:hypothetical protein
MLCVFEDKVSRKIFEPKKKELRRERRNAHNEEHISFYFPSDIARKSRSAYNMLVRKSLWKETIRDSAQTQIRFNVKIYIILISYDDRSWLA